MKFRHPDQAVRRFWALAEELSSPRAQDPYPTVGEECARCHRGPVDGVFPTVRIRRANRALHRQRRTIVCGGCGEPWEGLSLQEGQARRGRKKDGGRRSSTVEDRLVDLATLHTLLLKLDRWDRRVYCELFIREGIPAREIHYAAVKRWRRGHPRGASERTIWNVIRSARDELAALLRKREEVAGESMPSLLIEEGV